MEQLNDVSDAVVMLMDAVERLGKNKKIDDLKETHDAMKHEIHSIINKYVVTYVMYVDQASGKSKAEFQDILLVLERLQAEVALVLKS